MNLQTAIAERDTGINRVAANNEVLHKGWQILATAYLRVYAHKHKEFFPYDVTRDFEKEGYQLPSDDRCWGAVFLKLARDKVIRRGTSIGKHPKRHATAVVSWVSLIYRDAP